MTKYVHLAGSIAGLPHGLELSEKLSALHRPQAEYVAAGRNVVAGYTRGWGLEFGGLAESIRDDPVYHESLTLARDRTILSEHKLMNLFLIMKYGIGKLEGDIVEFGAYRGGSSIFLANVARRLEMRARVYAFDTFEGMPETHAMDMHSAGDFRDTNLDELKATVHEMGLTNLEFVKGLFQDTAEPILRKSTSITLAHIDCDIYEAVKYCLGATQEKMHRLGGYLVLDDALQGSCLGALHATEDWVVKTDVRAEQAYPHLVYRYPPLEGGQP